MRCVQKANALTLLVQKADAVACIVRTLFALTLVVRKANAQPTSVEYAYARAGRVRCSMCADMHFPDGEYLAGLRPERLDVSDAYAASGRIIFFLMRVYAEWVLEREV